MADALALAGDIVSCGGLMLLFLLLTDPRYPMRRTAALLSAVFAATAAAYIAAVLGLGLTPGQASLVCFSIPSLTACLLLSKYRDGRFLFTFCTIDVLGFMLIVSFPHLRRPARRRRLGQPLFPACADGVAGGSSSCASAAITGG